MRWVLSDITQSSVSIIQIVWVPQMMVCLDEFWIMVFVTRWFKNWWQSSKIKTAETCFQNSKTITQWHVHKPLFFFFPLLHCSFFLSSSLSILLFFLLQSKKLILTDHSHVQCSFCFLSIQCSLCSFFFVLFVLLPPVTRTLTQAERSSVSIFDHTPKSSTTYLFSSSLLSCSFFDLAEASKSASTATMDLRWKRFNLEALLSVSRTAPLEARFWSGSAILFFYVFYFVVYHK